jgi:MFS family permease
LRSPWKDENREGLKRQNKILYIVSLNHAINDGSTSLIATLFPVLLLDFGFPVFQIGILVAAGYLMNVVFQPIAGHYSEKFEPWILLSVGISMIAVSMVVFTLSKAFLSVLIGVIVLRVGSSVFHPVGVSAISRSYQTGNLDGPMGFQSAFGNLGILLVFLVSAPLYMSLGWRDIFLIFAALDLSIVTITIFAFRGTRVSSSSPQSGKRKSSNVNLRDEEGARTSLDVSDSKEATAEDNNSDPTEEDEKVQGFEHRRRVNSKEISLVERAFGLPSFFLSTMLISGGSFAVLVNYGNSLLAKNNFSIVSANLLISAWIASAFIGALTTGKLALLMERAKLLTTCYALAALATLMFALFPENFILALIALVVSGFFLSASYPIIYSELSAFLERRGKRDREVVQQHGKGAQFGVLFSAQIIGSVVFGFFSGYVSEFYPLNLPFEATAVFLLVASLISALWARSSRQSFPSFSGGGLVTKGGD